MTAASEKLAPLNERRTRLILCAALEVFAEQGLARAKIVDIAARASVSAETLLFRFGDIDALALQVIEWVALRTRLDPEAVLPASETAPRQLERLLLAVTAQATLSEGLTLLRLILADGWRRPDLARAYDERVRQPNLELARIFAERLSERGDMHQEDEDAFVAAFEGFVRAELEPMLLGVAPAPDAQAAKRHARAAARRLLRAFTHSALRQAETPAG
jgi:AcrR family transcriptional regulator